MHGFYNMAIRIDATQQSYRLEVIDNELLKDTLGGKGLATRLLLENNPPGVDPLSSDNHLILATGPVSGSGLWGSCRHGVFTKSPLTGFYSESYSGGTAAEYMTATGFDVVIIHGVSEGPVWIEICEDGAVFHPAGDLWGTDTFETEDRVKEWIRDNRPSAKRSGVVCIGPAGENQVAFAVLENDYWRSAGRTGIGAVMGSKNIKALAFWGDRKKNLADPDRLIEFVRETARLNKDNPGVVAYKTNGTPMLVDIMNNAGGFPTRYWKKGRAEHRESINAGALHQRCDVRPHACMKCFLACGRLSTVKDGRHKGLKIEGPEYETIYAFGGLCEVKEIEEIAYLNDICDRLGMDTITAGNLSAFTIEAVRQKKVQFSIDYNDVDGIAKLLHDMAHRKGLGETLARGLRFTASEWNMPEQAIHVKGLEPAGYDPRVLKGMGLAYGTSARGACHLRATFYKPELAGLVDPEQIEGKAKIFAEWEDRLTLFDTLILCRFYRDLYQWEQLNQIVLTTTGLDLDTDAMRRIAGRVLDDTRRFNLREGLVSKDDCLPDRFHSEALPETDSSITRDQMRVMLQEYYKERGWDREGRLLE